MGWLWGLSKRGAKDNSKGFGLNNWKNRVPITKMGKIAGRGGWGRELRVQICDTSKLGSRQWWIRKSGIPGRALNLR